MVVWAKATPRSAIICTRSRELNARYHLMHRTMISWSKCRPLKRSCAEVGSVIPAVIARHALQQFAPEPGKPRGTRDPELNLDARAQAFLDRIAPLSADLASHGRTRALALKKLRRICQAELRRLKARLSPATVKLYLSKYRDAGADSCNFIR
jgi:hypothetical protein